MIKKTILITLLLIICYNFIVIESDLSTFQSESSLNTIKAEKLIYAEESKSQKIIIGSSLGVRLNEEILSEFYNLSFAGLSIYDGLKVIEKSEIKPDYLLIETNILWRTESKSFEEKLFHPISYSLKSYLPFMREGKQPLANMTSFVINELKKIKNISREENNSVDQEEHNQKVDNDLLNKLIQEQKKSFSEELNDKMLYENLEKIKSYIEKIGIEKSNVFFFEMPLNPLLLNLERPKKVRENLYQFFPKNEYNYITLPDTIEFITTDGLHLSSSESKIYSNYLKESFLKITGN